EERELLAGELLLHDARGLGREAEEPDARRRGGETDRLLEQARMAHRVDDEGGSGNAETDERVAESLARRVDRLVGAARARPLEPLGNAVRHEHAHAVDTLEDLEHGEADGPRAIDD